MVPYILPFPDFDLFCEGKFCLFIKSLAIIIRQLCLEGSHYMPQYTIIIKQNKLIQCNFTSSYYIDFESSYSYNNKATLSRGEPLYATIYYYNYTQQTDIMQFYMDM